MDRKSGAGETSVWLLFKQIDTLFLCCLVFFVPVFCLPFVLNILQENFASFAFGKMFALALV